MKVIYVTTSITSFDFEEAIKEVNFIGVYVIPLVHCFLLILGYNIGI